MIIYVKYTSLSLSTFKSKISQHCTKVITGSFQQRKERSYSLFDVLFPPATSQLTLFVIQLYLFPGINTIAFFIKITFFLTFIVMNLDCFPLEIAAAPNFQPGFKYFERYTKYYWWFHI